MLTIKNYKNKQITISTYLQLDNYLEKNCNYLKKNSNFFLTESMILKKVLKLTTLILLTLTKLIFHGIIRNTFYFILIAHLNMSGGKRKVFLLSN